MKNVHLNLEEMLIFLLERGLKADSLFDMPEAVLDLVETLYELEDENYMNIEELAKANKILQYEWYCWSLEDEFINGEIEGINQLSYEPSFITPLPWEASGI